MKLLRGPPPPPPPPLSVPPLSLRSLEPKFFAPLTAPPGGDFQFYLSPPPGWWALPRADLEWQPGNKPGSEKGLSHSGGLF